MMFINVRFYFLAISCIFLAGISLACSDANRSANCENGTSECYFVDEVPQHNAVGTSLSFSNGEDVELNLSQVCTSLANEPECQFSPAECSFLEESIEGSGCESEHLRFLTCMASSACSDSLCTQEATGVSACMGDFVVEEPIGNEPEKAECTYAPPGWDCPCTYYGDGECDEFCGVVDFDC